MAGSEAAVPQILRAGQQRMADWQGGPLAVAAVPGAGKSTGMAAAAAQVLARRQAGDRRQLLLVTFTRAAVLALRRKLRQELQRRGLPQEGFTVLTLHGLGLQIAQSAGSDSGIDWANATLISPQRSHHLLLAAVDRWLEEQPQALAPLLAPGQAEPAEAERLRRLLVLRTDVLPDLARTAIPEAKSSGCDPVALGDRLARCPAAWLPALAQGIYRHYQQQLRAADRFDYDDLMLAALQALENPELRRRWQSDLLGVFEDEAQDSSPLQTRLLETLARDPDSGELRLVRVGDANQAINSSFTPADPRFFREFCRRWAPERLVTMDEAGRSGTPILTAANALQDWVNASLPRLEPPPFRLQPIRPVARPTATDNPAPIGRGVELLLSPDIEVSRQRLVERLAQLYRAEPDASLAVLVREHNQGSWLATALTPLAEQGLVIRNDCGEARRSELPRELLTVLGFLAAPGEATRLGALQALLERRGLLQGTRRERQRLLPEDLLYPHPLSPAPPAELQPLVRLGRELLAARQALPPLQLLPFAALALGYGSSELASADKLGDRLARQTGGAADLDTLVALLQELVWEESFEAVEAEEPETRLVRPGQLTITTMHRAKGLDWDAVFLPCLESNLIPGLPPFVPPEQDFLGGYPVAAIARLQLRALLHDPEATTVPDLPEALQQLQEQRQAEEYRLLYVAMTRPRRLLWMAGARRSFFRWNRQEQLSEVGPCPALVALAEQFPQWVV